MMVLQSLIFVQAVRFSKTIDDLFEYYDIPISKKYMAGGEINKTTFRFRILKEDAH